MDHRSGEVGSALDLRLGVSKLNGAGSSHMVGAFECVRVRKLSVASTREISAKMTWGAKQADLLELCLRSPVRHSRVTPNA